jgi:hypothetical protein
MFSPNPKGPWTVSDYILAYFLGIITVTMLYLLYKLGAMACAVR